MRKQEIADFSEKWIKKFLDKNMNFYDIFDTDEFPNECRKLEFKMDCGKSFEEKYSSDAFWKIEVLKKIIQTIDDANTLGNAIFSKWRYFNHWSYSHTDEEDITWFITALTRLGELVKEHK